MNELIHIGNADISIKVYNGQRVVTFKDVDMAHERPDGTARRNFSTNRKHFAEGEDFFIVTPQTLENTELYEKRTLENDVTSNRGTALITEQGYLMLVKSFTDDLAWEVQRQLVNGYFRAKEIVNAELSPELQMLQGLLSQMVQKELADKERDRQIAIAQEKADKAVEINERMKDELISPFDNWREDINLKVREIAIKSEIPYRDLFGSMYKELEGKAGCDLAVRQRNKRDRMKNSGCRKGDIDKETLKIAIIEEDKKLKQIFEGIVRQYAMKYCA